jgi:hypothetical protein
MPVAAKITLLAFCATALIFVALKFILPLILLYFGGVGVENPLPRRLASAHPNLAIYLFVLGGPILFFALVVTGIWLLRLPTTPH